MTDKIRVGDQWYVSAKSARAEENPHVLKHDETFVLFDRFGDVQVLGSGEQGLYHEDTRYLSHLELLIDGVRPMFLGSAVKEDNSVLVVELMNPDLPLNGVAKGSLHLFRAKLLWQGTCYEHLRLTNHGDEKARLRITLQFDADFVDLFEVRGMERARRGERLATEVGDAEVLLGYRGLDGRTRRTRVSFEPTPTALTERQADFDLELARKQEQHVYLTAACEQGDARRPAPPRYDVAFRRNDDARRASLCDCSAIETSNPLVNRWLHRSVCDLAMLTTTLPSGPYPYAGVPWYSTTFGRDGIITAREYLWIDPSLARGVLSVLAATQATAEDPSRDAEPGKILHEARKCEMANTREVPFGQYYGTVDATPLFVGLAGAYFHRTGDLDFIRRLWPHVTSALEWIDRYGDRDGDGFVEYRRRNDDGLLNQGWKDSFDAIRTRDGRLAEPPIALVEVQGYVWDAKRRLAGLARGRGEGALADRLTAEAESLRARFEEAFWMEEAGTYAIALDANKRQADAITSNPGHALWSGIVAPERAARVAASLSSPALSSGWGIRTLAADQVGFNPIGYHLGSVWPHDNAIIAAGLKRYGFAREAGLVAEQLLGASRHFREYRLPELFCGFSREESQLPVPYPVACVPQAWAAGAPFSLLQTMLGLRADAPANTLELVHPELPEWLEKVIVRDMTVGGAVVDLHVYRSREGTGVEVVRKSADLNVVVRA